MARRKAHGSVGSILAAATTAVVLSLVLATGGYGDDVGGDEPGQVDTGTPGHFTCYEAKDLARRRVSTVALTDQFREDVAVDVYQLTRLCTPTEKVHGDKVFPPPGGFDGFHLVCYKTKDRVPPSFVAEPIVSITNQFVVDASVQVQKPQELCVPSTKTLSR